MSLNKNAYFQGGGGVNKPEPKKKKYKSDPAIVVQPRFKEPFYRNYDLYNVPGEHGPGAGYHDMEKYKSVSEFLKAKRKKLKDKYKADDSWILDDNSKTKKNPDRKARMDIFDRIIKTGIDFPLDEQINHYDMIYPEEGQYHKPSLMGPSGKDDLTVEPGSTGTGTFQIAFQTPQIAGEHSYVPTHDFMNRSDEALNFGHDSDEEISPARGLTDKILEKLFNKYLSPSETDLFGLPDGIDPNSDLDAERTEQVEQPFTGKSDIGTDIYEDKWNI